MSETEKAILLALVEGPDGEAWIESRNGWRPESGDVCSWDGIRCDGENVKEINLKDSDLTASIPASIGSLSSLTHLHLASNKLFGEIPSTLADMPNLVHVDLSMNNIRGQLPMFRSKGLEFLNLSHNQLTGTLPKKIGNMGSDRIKVFDIKYNRMNGVIPASIGGLSDNLMELDLSSNKFDGSIPGTLGSLTNLEGLFLSNNDLTGTIPASLTRSNLALSQIFLHGNALSGTLPVALADLPNLKNLFVDDNKLTGEVPPELCALRLNEVFFQQAGQFMPVAQGGDDDEDDVVSENGNNEVQINGVKIPVVKEGENSGRTRRAQASGARDGCNSIACPSGSYSIGEGKDGVWPCELCRHDYLNPYIGANSCFVLDQSQIMQKFFESTNGDGWVGDYENWLSESSPVCSWNGISCNNEGDIISIVLPNSNLIGRIPENIGFLRHLEVLDLSDNDLTGELPSDLHFAPLEVMDISGNMLEGFVPSTLCEKSGLNRNGVGGVFSCDNIACAAGTYSSTGRAGDGDCLQCGLQSSIYLGSKTCEGPVASVRSTSYGSPFGAVVASGLVALGILMLVGLAAYMLRKRGPRNDGGGFEPEVQLFAHPEDEIPTSYVSRNMPAPSEEGMSGTFPVDGDSLPPVSVQVKAKNAWNCEKESRQEVWLDVPKIN